MKWRPRERNKEADFLANLAMDSRADFDFCSGLNVAKQPNVRLMGWSDGGLRPESGCSSHAWILKAWFGNRGPFIVAAHAKFFAYPARSSLEVEATGVQSLWRAILQVIQGQLPDKSFSSSETELDRSAKRRRCLALGRFM